MAGKKRADNKGRILCTGERQRPEDNRYLYRYFDSTGKRRIIYALTLSELREKEKQIQRDLQDGIDISRSDMTLNQLFQMYMDNKTDLRESTRCNYISVWNNGLKDSVHWKYEDCADQADSYPLLLFRTGKERAFCEHGQTVSQSDLSSAGACR